MAEHKHGSMDITAQQKTFDGFVSFTIKSVIAIFVFLVFLALVGA
ncbi:MAG: aa3-type cytochrome c oxidase subunit IV [Mangrovicoccus sp.]